MSNDSKLRVQLDDEDLRQVTLFAATCARSALPLFTASRPLDSRTAEAIAEAEAFAAGKRRTATLRAAAWSAHAAARDLNDGPAAHAAYAASHAAAAAFLHPVASTHQVKHILGAAVHQAIAFELETPENEVVGAQQLHWAANLATSSVRDVLRRFPRPRPGRGRFAELLAQLDAQLRR